jgi:hypothetical protein
MMSGVSDLGVFQIVWPGVSTLLGALAGGGVTLWANRQKNSHEQRASNEARTRSIKDRSFNACVDLLKAARLVGGECDSLWFEVYNKASNDRVIEYDRAFQTAIRNWYAAAEAVRLTVPPAATDTFLAWGVAMMTLAKEVDGYKNDYLRGDSWSYEENEARSGECIRLRDEMLIKRDEFAEVLKTQLDEGVWSKTH